MRSDALIALTRFGLGPRPGERRHAAGDPRGFVLAQLGDRDAARIDGLMSLEELRGFYIEAEKPYIAAAARFGDGATEAENAALTKARKSRAQSFRRLVEQEIGVRFERGASTNAAFVERLVLFWSNHFTVDRNRNKKARVLAGNFEREAIRPYVLGNFGDMLRAAILHPAMLQYLDNVKNVAPNSSRGRRRGVKAANENLARELLELHTLGAGGGYTQDDVQQVALTLAGWTGDFDRGRPQAFNDRYHDDAPRTVLGRTYPAAGAEQIELLLPDLARHPSTGRHIARKLARHFVGDIAPATLVDALADSFTRSGGDLRDVAQTLASHDAAWQPDAYKTVPPYDFTVAAARALGRPDLPARLVAQATKDLAQDIWAPPSPAGWPDDDRAFLGGDSMLERIDFAAELVGRSDLPDMRGLAVDLFGDDLAPEVAQAVARAEDSRQAGVLLLMSPPFQRR